MRWFFKPLKVLPKCRTAARPSRRMSPSSLAPVRVHSAIRKVSAPKPPWGAWLSSRKDYDLWPGPDDIGLWRGRWTRAVGHRNGRVTSRRCSSLDEIAIGISSIGNLLGLCRDVAPKEPENHQSHHKRETA